MEKGINGVKKLFAIIFGFVGIAMILVETYAVFGRNVLKIATPWTDEFLKLLFIWSIFVGAAMSFLDDSSICLTLVENSAGVRKRPAVYGVLKVIQYVTGFGVSAFMIKHLATIISTQMRTGEATTVMKYPLWILNMGLMVGMVLVCIFAVIKIFDCRKYFQKDAKIV